MFVLCSLIRLYNRLDHKLVIPPMISSSIVLVFAVKLLQQLLYYDEARCKDTNACKLKLHVLALCTYYSSNSRNSDIISQR